MVRTGRPQKEKPTKSLMVRIDATVKDELAALAEREGRTQAWLTELALRDLLAQEKQTAAGSFVGPGKFAKAGTRKGGGK